MHIEPYGPTPRHVETFSYLPPMTPERLRQQVAYLIDSGWSPAIEHTEPEKSMSNFWYLWELPYFGERSVDKILAELDSCHRPIPVTTCAFSATTTTSSLRARRLSSTALGHAENGNVRGPDGRQR